MFRLENFEKFPCQAEYGGYILVIQYPRVRLKEDPKFEVSLGYVGKSCLKQQQNQVYGNLQVIFTFGKWSQENQRFKTSLVCIRFCLKHTNTVFVVAVLNYIQ